MAQTERSTAAVVQAAASGSAQLCSVARVWFRLKVELAILRAAVEEEAASELASRRTTSLAFLQPAVAQDRLAAAREPYF